MRIPVFGVFAALGLMSALTLSQRTARYANLSPEAVWNAGVTAILSAFAISRLLLIAFNLHSFLQYPLLILALPSLTTTGILITALFMLGYIRWRKLSLLPLLDAAAPCAALLWAFLSLGRQFDGTRDGMPITSSISGSAPRSEPVELFTFMAALILCRALLGLLKHKPGEEPRTAGTVTSAGLLITGLVIFFLDFFRLPSDLLPSLWLDPSQIIGAAMILVGTALLVRTRTEVKRESGTEPPHAI
jgi:phosphatidylglycerol:prolipoprotein diacylglycerol transferase